MTKIRMLANKRVWLRENMQSCTLPVRVQTEPTSVGPIKSRDTP